MSIAKSLFALLGGAAAAGLVGAVALAPAAGVTGYAVAKTNETMQSNLSDLTDGSAPGVTTVTDVEGTPIAYLYKQRRYEVASDQISQTMKDAIVSIEDRRFYEHDGVDIMGTVRALATNLLSGGVSQGASTLDQQYVKNFLLLVQADDEAEQLAATETSIPRKLREMRMASDLDQLLSKDEILTRYLNLVPFGNNAFGVEAAARTYFGISAAELTAPQAAMLAGIVQSSSYLDPYTNGEAVLERRNTVLDTMVSTGTLDAQSAEQFKAEPLGVLETPQGLSNGCISAGDAGFMCDYALTYLDSKGLDYDTLTDGAYTIRTTLDPAVQAAAHQAVTSNVSPTAPGVAEVLNVVAPGDERNILAMTSSRDYGLDLEQSQTVLPQPTSLVGNGAGSVFKLFTAAVALSKGIGINTTLDVPVRFEAQGMGDGGAANCPAGTYCVENAGVYPSSMTLQQALAQSPNTTFVKLLQQVGVPDVVDLSVALGLRSYATEGSFDGESSIADYMKEHNLGSYTLGPTAVNPLELSNVGASIASGGRWCEPNPIASITDRYGNEVYLDRPDCEDVLDTDVANALMSAMSEDTVDGTASAAARAAGWSLPTAAKTGTTESNQSSAFIGFNSTFSAAPYIYNDGTTISPLCSSPVRQCSNGGLFGGNEPAATWFQTANAVPLASQGTLPGVNGDFAAGTAAARLNDVAGLTESDARNRLAQQGYTVISTRTVDGNGVPRGRVVRGVLAGDVLADRRVILEISNGQTTRTQQQPTEEATPGQQLPSQPNLDDLAAQLRERLGL